MKTHARQRLTIDYLIQTLTLNYLDMGAEHLTEADLATMQTLWAHPVNQKALDLAARLPLNPKVNPPPCVNSDAQQETTHGEQAQPHVHEWNPLAALPNSEWQDVCVTCGAHRIVKAGE